MCHSYESGMSHESSLTPSSSPSSFFGNVPEGGNLLPAGHIHVWRAIVDVPFARLQVYQETLSPDEQARAQRFKLSQHQRRFTAARGILRHILARYLRTSPRDIRFQSGPFGKPFLQDLVDHPLHFNLAHSQHLAVYAVSHDLEVGIDLEADRNSLDYARLAERICNPDELMTFRKLPPGRTTSGIFPLLDPKRGLCQSYRKRIFVSSEKSDGFLYLRRTAPNPQSPIRSPVRACPRLDRGSGTSVGDRLIPDDWSLLNLPLGQGFWGALAVAGRPSLIQGWDYHPED